MKKNITPTLLVAAFLVAAANLTAHAQAKPAPPPRYADLVGDNPTTEADLQTVGSYLNLLLLAGNTEQAKLLLADTYRGYGPAAADSSETRDQVMASWQRNYKTQTDRKMRLEGQTTFRVKSGGWWVTGWLPGANTRSPRMASPSGRPFSTWRTSRRGKLTWTAPTSIT